MSRIRLRNVSFIDPGIRDVDGTDLPIWISAEKGYFIEWDPEKDVIYYNRGVRDDRGEMVPRPFAFGRGQQHVSGSRSKGMEMLPSNAFVKWAGGGLWELVAEDRRNPPPPYIPASAAEVFTPNKAVAVSAVEFSALVDPPMPGKILTTMIGIAGPVEVTPELLAMTEEERHHAALAAVARAKAAEAEAAKAAEAKPVPTAPARPMTLEEQIRANEARVKKA